MKREKTAGTESGFPRRAFLTLAAAGLYAARPVNDAVEAAEPTDTERANAKVVTDFCAAWKTGDAAKVGDFLADNCVVRFTASTDNSPAVSGRAAVVEQVGKFLTGNTIEFLVQETYAKGPIVVNRRTDRINSATGSREIQVVGVFFVKQGKIKEWHDFGANA